MIAAPLVAVTLSLFASPTRTLTLADALGQARQRPAMQKAMLQTAIGKARVGQALSPLLPQISGSASYQRTTANFVSRPSQVPTTLAQQSSSFDTANFFSLGLNVNQLLYDSQQSIDRLRAAQATADSNVAAEQVARLATELEVRSNYYVALAQKALVRVAAESVAVEEKRLRQIEGFVRVGTRPEIDLAQTRVQLANARVQLTTANGNFEAARAQLNLSIGLLADTDFDVVDEPLRAVEDEGAALAALIGEAERRRPDLVQLDKRVRAAELTLSSTKGSYGPSLSASMGLTYAGREVDKLVWNWNMSLGVQWSMFTGLSTWHAVKEADATLRSLRADRDQQKLQIQLDCSRATIAVRTAKEALVGSKEAHAAAKERVRLAEGRYAAGVGNIIELGDAQLALVQAAAQEVQAQLNLMTARAQLLAALGRDE